MFDYHYSVHNDFPSRKIAPSVMHKDVVASAITTEFYGITVDGDSCRCSFATELSPNEKMILDSIVAGHAGEAPELPESVFGTQVYTQDTEPTLDEFSKLAIWTNTNDNKTYLVFWRGADDQVKVQLT